MGKVRYLPLTARDAARIIREVAADSSRVEIVCPLHDGAWRSLVDHLQVIRCLEDGSVIGRPTVDEHGNSVCMMTRYGAGETVELTVAIDRSGTEPRLIVTDFRSDGESPSS